MTIIDDWQKDLLKEKSLLRVYLVSRRFRSTTFNKTVRIIILACLLSFCITNEWHFRRSLITISQLTDTIRTWADTGLSFASQVLGFLVAGFTIFATLTKPSLFISLARTCPANESVSGLKFIFFNFMLVFIHYMGFLATCVVIKMFGAPSGLTAVVLRRLSSGTDDVKAIIVYLAFVTVGFWFLNLLILLKSFVWNVYQSVVLSIVFEGDQLRAPTKSKFEAPAIVGTKS